MNARERGGKVIGAFVAAGGDKATPPAVLGVKKDDLDAASDEMQKKYGTIEQYFSEWLGLDAGRQEALRDLDLGRIEMGFYDPPTLSGE